MSRISLTPSQVVEVGTLLKKYGTSGATITNLDGVRDVRVAVPGRTFTIGARGKVVPA